MRVLAACEESGRVRDAFRFIGHDAWSCDILPSDDMRYHIQDDVLNHLKDWDLIIAFPPCDYLTNAGNGYYHAPGWSERMRKRDEAVEFVQALWDAPCEKLAIENPVGYLSKNWKTPTQYIQPYYFGNPYSKKTCLWLRGLPKLVQDRPYYRSEITPWVLGSVTGRGVFYGAETKRDRSRTFTGVARAMADQWGMNGDP